MRTYANGHICNSILSKNFSHFYTGHICDSILGNIFCFVLDIPLYRVLPWFLKVFKKIEILFIYLL